MTEQATMNRFSTEVRVRAVLEHVGKRPARWAAAVSIAAKIGCAVQTLHGRTKKPEVDWHESRGNHAFA